MASRPLFAAAVFERPGQAESAIDELVHAGFSEEQIGIVAPGGRTVQASTATERVEDSAADGAVTGTVAGGALGAIVGGLVAGLVPGIGPILAGGILTGVVLGGATGATAGSWIGPFIALGMTEDQAVHFESELRAGRTVVVVQTPERREEAHLILERHGGHPVEMNVGGGLRPA